MSTCIASKPDGTLCRRPAAHLDVIQRGMVCDAHRTLTEAIREEIEHLTSVFQQRGAEGMIAEAADTIAKLRRGLLAVVKPTP